MSYRSSSRIIVITLVLTALAAIIANANWGSGFSSIAAGREESAPMLAEMQSPLLGKAGGSLFLPPPSLGTYANTTITPSSTPTDTTSISVTTNSKLF